MADEQQNGDNKPDLEKYSKSKEEAEESFLREIDEEESKIDSQPEKASAQTAAPEKKKDSSFASKYKSLLSKPARKRHIDPILGVCFAIFILCSCVVLANTVVSEVVKNTTDLVVETGDTVEVDYVGSFNDYYYNKADNVKIFDTSKKDIGTSDEYPKSWTFQKEEDSYKWLSFEAGGSDVLTGFGAATIGHKVGDKIEVHILNGDGYVLKSSQKGTTGLSFDIPTTYTATDFKNLFGYTAPTNYTVMDFDEDNAKSFPFGVGYSVFTDDFKMVHVDLDFSGTSPFHMYGQDDGVSFTVANNTLTITGANDNSPGIAMINGKLTRVFYDAYSPTNDTSIGYKLMYDSSKSLEAYDTDLYFVIEIKKITKK